MASRKDRCARTVGSTPFRARASLCAAGILRSRSLKLHFPIQSKFSLMQSFAFPHGGLMPQCRNVKTPHRTAGPMHQFPSHKWTAESSSMQVLVHQTMFEQSATVSATRQNTKGWQPLVSQYRTEEMPGNTTAHTQCSTSGSQAEVQTSDLFAVVWLDILT